VIEDLIGKIMKRRGIIEEEMMRITHNQMNYIIINDNRIEEVLHNHNKHE